ncbi:flavin reductase family protein [Haloechinothrix salitolerans]|uniref:Flavin reductase family protein n=1 Tax=Haloechinothrix salitolerans TaxID=926830 RepID=A0ABW2C5G9_9PSEU
MSTRTTVDIDPTGLREAFGHFPTGVVAVCAEIGGERVGMAVSSFVPVSLEPPLVAFCVQNTSTTWPSLQRSSEIGVSVLGERHERAVRSLAGDAAGRFTELRTETHQGGALFIDGASVWLTTVVTDITAAGDHLIVVLRVRAMRVQPTVEPIVFHRSGLRRLAPERS